MIVAIITARGGSIGVPRKNVLPIAGKPLIAWSIEHALNSKLVDEVYVTTEDPEIKEVSLKYGAKVIDRPKELSTDEISSLPAIKHALDNIEDVEYFVLLQPTSPIRNRFLIDDCIAEMIEKEVDGVFTTKVNCRITLGDDIRRQDAEKWKEWDGNVYVGKPYKMFDDYECELISYKNSQAENIEIDTPFEFWMAEQVLKHYNYEPTVEWIEGDEGPEPYIRS